MCFLHYSFCLVLQRGRLPCEPGSAALHTWCFFGSVDKLCWLFVPELFHLFSISLLYPRAHSTRETRDGVSWCRVRTERPAGQVYLTGAPGGQLWTPYWWWLDSPVCHCTHRHKVGMPCEAPSRNIPGQTRRRAWPPCDRSSTRFKRFLNRSIDYFV